MKGFGLIAWLGACAIACGSDGASEPGSTTAPPRPSASAGFGPAPSSTGSSPPLVCAKTSVASQLVPVDLVFMFDESGSMDNDGKWDACSAGLKTFFADPATKGISASIQFFPLQTGDYCDANRYAAPHVGLRPLPDGPTFANSIDDHEPTDDRGTPTLPALTGAIAYAESVLAGNPTHRVAVVVVTDGEPRECGSAPDNVSAAAAAVKNRILTFVVGVGGSQNLDALAASGGTQKAIVVDTQSPAQTTANMLAALDQIKGTVGCELLLPQTSEPTDPNKVNVSVTRSGQAVTLDFDDTCQGGAGWHYDVATAPTKIILCPATCKDLRADASVRIDVELGCATKRAPK